MAPDLAQPPADAPLEGRQDAVDNEGARRDAGIGEEARFDADGEADDRAYNPSDLEATRARQQGLGFGARDLARQRDPSRPAPALDEAPEKEV
jgi:hypothetical protein